MDRPTIQIGVTGMLLLVAGVAINLWLFRLGVLWGILGLSVTKHLVIAQLCMMLGVNRRQDQAPAPRPRAREKASTF